MSLLYIQQGAGQTITIGISGFLQSDGTFTGTTGNISLGNTSPFQLLGGTFTSTGSTLTLRHEFLINGGTFSHNSGTVVFTFLIGTGFKTINITANGTAAFNNLTFTGSPTNLGNSIIFAIQAGDTLQVASLFTFKRSGGSGPLIANGGTIELSGNVDFGSGATGGTTLLKFLGTGSQTYTNADSLGRLPVVEVDKTGGSLSAAPGTTRFGSTGFTLTQGTFGGPTGTHENRGNFTVTAGTYTHNNGTLLQTFSVGTGLANLTIDVPGTQILGSLSLQGSPTNPGNSVNHIITSGDVLHLVGNLDMQRTSGSGPVRVRTNGTIEVEGNITIATVACDSTGGGTLITLTGTNNQTITHTSGTPPTGNWTVDKAGGSASLLTGLTINAASQQLIVDQGTFDCNGFNLTVNSAISVNSGGNFQLQGGETISPNPTFNSGSLATYTGNGDSNPDTFVLKNWPYRNLEIAGIDAADVFELPTNLSVNENLTLTGGTLDATASDFDVNINGSWTEAGGVFVPRGGDVEFLDNSVTSTISGTTTFFDFTCIAANKTLTFEAGTTQNITGQLTLTGTSGNQVVLNSTSPGTQWRIRTQNDEFTRDVSFVNVTDSVNLGIPMIFTNPPNDPTGSTDGGNTVNWFTDVTPVSITATATPTNANGNTWSLNATTADGFTPYTWLWTTPTAGVTFGTATDEDTTVNLAGAPADTVITLTVTVTDDNGFSDSFDVLVIRSSTALDVTASGTPAAGSESTGNVWDITSTASGGVPVPGQSPPNDYTYTWTGPAGVVFGNANLPATTADLTGAAADTDLTLTITVQDLFGTTDSFNITVYRSSTGISAVATAVYVTPPVPDPFNPDVIVITGTANAFTLTGVLSDAGGPITASSEVWNDLTTPNPAFSTSNPVTVNAPGTAGTYTYEYRGTDSHGLIGIGTVDVFVVDPVTAVATATPPILDLFVNLSTTLNAIGSTGGAPDAGFGGYTYEWRDLDTNTVLG
ncbi:MAG: hypothetical protein L6Q69_18200, partial [Zoogloea sp.]|nr:hypothetical protein [Zoogloea sp.]